MTEADDGDMHGNVPLNRFGRLVQSDALSSILHVDGGGETAGVVHVADDQAASARAIGFELDAVEEKAISDATASKNNMFAASELRGFVHLILSLIHI